MQQLWPSTPLLAPWICARDLPRAGRRVHKALIARARGVVFEGFIAGLSGADPTLR